MPMGFLLDASLILHLNKEVIYRVSAATPFEQLEWTSLVDWHAQMSKCVAEYLGSHFLSQESQFPQELWKDLKPDLLNKLQGLSSFLLHAARWEMWTAEIGR